MISKNQLILLLAAIAAFIIALAMLLKPIEQPLAYHNFADQRSWLRLDNTLNVLSNIPFALGGILGLFLLLTPGKVQFIDPRERWPWVGVSIGLILTAIGSSYYHLEPNNSRLVWDRLPMTVVFMSFVAALISERVNIRLGLWLWPVLLAVGFYSVLDWHESELKKNSDLRFYLGVQTFTFLTTLAMLLVKAPYSRKWDLAIVIIFYGLAVFFERFDQQIFIFTKDTISGHTLKHLAAAAAGTWLIYMVWKRKIL